MLVIRRLFASILLLVLVPVCIPIVTAAFLLAAITTFTQVIGKGLMNLIILMIKGIGKMARVDLGLEKKQ
jgi:hypothetical protein